MMITHEGVPLPEQGPTVHGLFRVAYATRQKLEQVWDADTAFQGIVLQPGDPPSRGQCGVSSLWFSRELCSRGLTARFVEGEILLGGEAKEGHCWVEVDQPDGGTITVDVTSDQYRTLFGSPVHVGAAGGGDGPACYVRQYSFDPFNVPHRKLSARCDILTKRMQWGRAKRIAHSLRRLPLVRRLSQ